MDIERARRNYLCRARFRGCARPPGRLALILGLASTIYLSFNAKIEFPKAKRDVKEEKEKKENTTKENVQETPITPPPIENLEKKVEENNSEESNINVNNHQNIVVTPWFQTFFPFKQRENHHRRVNQNIVVEEPMIPQTPKKPQPVIVKIKDVQSNEMTAIKTHLMNCGFATEDVNSAIQKLEKNKETIDVSSVINEISQIHSIFPLARGGCINWINAQEVGHSTLHKVNENEQVLTTTLTIPRWTFSSFSNNMHLATNTFFMLGYMAFGIGAPLLIGFSTYCITRLWFSKNRPTKLVHQTRWKQR